MPVRAPPVAVVAERHAAVAEGAAVEVVVGEAAGAVPVALLHLRSGGGEHGLWRGHESPISRIRHRRTALATHLVVVVGLTVYMSGRPVTGQSGRSGAHGCVVTRNW